MKSMSRISFVVATGLAIVLAGSAKAGIVAGPLSYPGNDHLYYLLDQADQSSWANLEAESVSLGGHLVTINDAAENEWIRSTFPAYGPHNMWIGLNDIVEEGVFEWVSGEPVTYTNWEPGQPSGDSDVVGMGYVNGQWGDEPWGSVRGVAEIVPEPMTALLMMIGGAVLLRRRRPPARGCGAS